MTVVEHRIKICREFEYRRTIKTNALTVTLIVSNGGKILKPHSARYSKTGAHGTEVYCLTEDEWSKVWIVKLYQSNSGKRSAIIQAPENVKTIIEQLWMYEDADVEDIAMTVSHLYKIMSR
jgi:hypothetical protein